MGAAPVGIAESSRGNEKRGKEERQIKTNMKMNNICSKDAE